MLWYVITCTRPCSGTAMVFVHWVIRQFARVWYLSIFVFHCMACSAWEKNSFCRMEKWALAQVMTCIVYQQLIRHYLNQQGRVPWRFMASLSSNELITPGFKLIWCYGVTKLQCVNYTYVKIFSYATVVTYALTRQIHLLKCIFSIHV